MPNPETDGHVFESKASFRAAEQRATMPRVILSQYDNITPQTMVGDTGLNVAEWLEYWQHGKAETWYGDQACNKDCDECLKLAHELCHARMIIDRLLGNPPCDGEERAL